MPDEKQFSFNATGNIPGTWIFVGYLMKVTAQLMIMISFPDCTVSPRPLRAVVGGGEDLGVDDGQEEHGEGVDDGDADQADRGTHNIGGLVTMGEVRLQGLQNRNK